MDQKEVFLNTYSQPHVLQQYMREERLTHGQRITADLNPVRLERDGAGRIHMYFCPLQIINTKEVLVDGDGGRIPDEAILKGIKIPANLAPGLYQLKNVELFSNGTMQVIATEQTKFEPFDNYELRQQQMCRNHIRLPF